MEIATAVRQVLVVRVMAEGMAVEAGLGMQVEVAAALALAATQVMEVLATRLVALGQLTALEVLEVAAVVIRIQVHRVWVAVELACLGKVRQDLVIRVKEAEAAAAPAAKAALPQAPAHTEVEALAQTTSTLIWVALGQAALCGLSGPAQRAHSHQPIPAIFN
jgi:hypothetical protein